MSILLLGSQPAWPAPQATVQSSGNQDPNGCGFWGDSLTLSVIDQGKKILKKDYCSAYGKSKVQVITDTKAQNFVLLEYSEGHGTNATTDYLVVYALTKTLAERARALISFGVGLTSRWFYDYVVETPSVGGLKLVMTLRVWGIPDPGTLPEASTKIVEVLHTQ